MNVHRSVALVTARPSLLEEILNVNVVAKERC